MDFDHISLEKDTTNYVLARQWCILFGLIMPCQNINVHNEYFLVIKKIKMIVNTPVNNRTALATTKLVPNNLKKKPNQKNAIGPITSKKSL